MFKRFVVLLTVFMLLSCGYERVDMQEVGKRFAQGDGEDFYKNKRYTVVLRNVIDCNRIGNIVFVVFSAKSNPKGEEKKWTVKISMSTAKGNFEDIVEGIMMYEYFEASSKAPTFTVEGLLEKGKFGEIFTIYDAKLRKTGEEVVNPLHIMKRTNKLRIEMGL